MWLTAPNRIGIAGWQTGDSIWQFSATSDQGGPRLQFGKHSLAVLPSGDEPLPSLDEQFVRGQELHLSFPQVGDDCKFGFQLVIRPVHPGGVAGDAGRIVFELLFSVQTTLLDSHPTVDLVVTPASQVETSEVAGVSNAIHLAASAGTGSAAVLLGSRDAPYTTRIKQPGSLRLRLFGGFLEKGVIRRARPWVILDRTDHKIDLDETANVFNALADSPLPLK